MVFSLCLGRIEAITLRRSRSLAPRVDAAIRGAGP
jgi:hypothetical protein